VYNSRPSPPWVQRFCLAMCLHTHTHTHTHTHSHTHTHTHSHTLTHTHTHTQCMCLLQPQTQKELRQLQLHVKWWMVRMLRADMLGVYKFLFYFHKCLLKGKAAPFNFESWCRWVLSFHTPPPPIPREIYLGTGCGTKSVRRQISCRSRNTNRILPSSIPLYCLL